MDTFTKQFIMEMFLDSDHVTTINRSAISLANIIKDNSANVNAIIETVRENWDDAHAVSYYSGIYGPSRRIKDYYEQTVANFDDEEYFTTFKVRRDTVQALVEFLQPLMSPGMIPIDKKVHIFLMYIMSDLSFNDVGRLFGLHKSSASHIFLEIASTLTENRFSFIRWPSLEEQHVTRIKVNNRFRFPNCVGFIDTCRFNLGPKSSSKSKDVVLLQGVCDENLMFIDLCIGDVGQTKKWKVYKESSLMYELPNFVDCENHILGDSEYKLNINLITPFKSEELLTSEEMKFNEVHWKARSYIGRAFEMLKEKFRKLNHIDIYSNSVSVNTLLYSACVLHNFIISKEGCSEVKEEDIACGVTLNSDIEMNAVEKRQYLCNYINYIDTDENYAT